MRQLIVLVLLAAINVGCASTTPVPENFTPNLIAVTASDSTPYWSSMIIKEFRERANRRAGYDIVTSGKTAPYTLDVRIVNKDRRQSGMGPIQFGGHISYRVRVEARADLKDSQGKIIWEWEGWDSAKNEEKAVAGLAEKASVDLDKAGVLKPGVLKP